MCTHCSRSSSLRRMCRCTIAAHLMRWRGKNLACTHHEMTDDGVKEFADASQVFKIDYVGDEIAVEWTLNRAGGNNSMTDEMQQADESDIKTAGESICTKISVDGTDRKETKNRLKLALYSMIEKGTGKKPSVGAHSRASDRPR